MWLPQQTILDLLRPSPAFRVKTPIPGISSALSPFSLAASKILRVWTSSILWMAWLLSKLSISVLSDGIQSGRVFRTCLL